MKNNTLKIMNILRTVKLESKFFGSSKKRDCNRNATSTLLELE